MRQIRPGQLRPAHRDASVDDHGSDPLRRLPGVCKSSTVLDARRIEDNYISPIAFANQAAFGQPEDFRRQTRGTVDSILQGQQLFVAHEFRKDAGKRARPARMRPP